MLSRSMHRITDRATRAWHWWLRRPGEQKLTLTFEFVIAFATTIYACVAIRQLGAMGDSVEQMRLTNELTRSQIKAQLVVEVGKLSLTAGQRGLITVDLKNTGQLPAHISSLKAELSLRRSPRSQPQYKRGDLSRSVWQAPVPNAPLPLGFLVRALNDKKWRALCAGQVTFKMFGEVEYQNGFGVASPLRFCMFWKAARPCDGEWAVCPVEP
jgi:hypothetical protein